MCLAEAEGKAPELPTNYSTSAKSAAPEVEVALPPEEDIAAGAQLSMASPEPTSCIDWDDMRIVPGNASVRPTTKK